MPGRLRELLTPEARHAYLDGAVCPAIRFTPLNPPPARLAQLGLVIQPSAGAISAYRWAGGEEYFSTTD
jgi:hypothetical protein